MKIKLNKLTRIQRYGFLLMIVTLISSCQSPGQEIQDQDLTSELIEINVNREVSYQEMEHFGASDAWSGQFVGLWPDAKRNAIAELLFSQENDDKGNPKGIGLSLWRFNIGAGSAQQGEQSGISDEWRRAESFMEPDGSYNWNRQKGQVWLAKAAKDFGVKNLLVFPNSPPVNMTKNGKAFATDGSSNLSEENFEAYSEYLAKVIQGLEKMGLDVNYVSPVNEPQWDWSDGGQEGTPFWNNEISGIVKYLDLSLSNYQIDTKIDFAEAGKINYLYEQADKQGRGEQVRDFFIPESSNYLGDLSHVSKNISAHSYFTTSPYESAVNMRQTLASEISSIPGLGYWMSEYCILGDNEGEINGSGRDLGIDPAIYMARVIHNDLTVANASAWHWWLAVSPYNYKDGLIYIDKNKEDGKYEESKMLWALGNYSRFIRPGYRRISVETDTNKAISPDLLVSAYISPESDNTENHLVFVFVNSGIKDLTVSLKDEGELISIQEMYVTSKDKSLSVEEIDSNQGQITLPARSIVTAVTDSR